MRRVGGNRANYVNGCYGSSCRCKRRPFVIRCVLVGSAALAASCVAPAAVQRAKERYPDAQFESRLSGCVTPGESARRFGSDARAAFIWSRESVKAARYFPCTAVLRAVTAGDTADVYRLSLTRDGSYEERALAPK
jgi:hypothetical protein